MWDGDRAGRVCTCAYEGGEMQLEEKGWTWELALT